LLRRLLGGNLLRLRWGDGVVLLLLLLLLRRRRLLSGLLSRLLFGRRLP
jgi:hypothetical protein